MLIVFLINRFGYKRTLIALRIDDVLRHKYTLTIDYYHN